MFTKKGKSKATVNEINGTTKRELLNWIIIFVLSFAVGLFLNFTFKPTLVSGSSMYPTLEDGNMLLLKPYQTEGDYGDILVFRSPTGTLFIKRLIAKEGDHIIIENGKVFLNEEELSEPYINDSDIMTFLDYTVPEGSYFFMGDNRNNSFDSRDLGAIPKEQVVGVVLERIFPLQRIKNNTFKYD